MEGEVSSTITTGRQSKTPSLNSSDELNSTVKRCRPNSTVSIGRFKGVVSQQNGHWGAQIYAKHQRVWLGTFKSEKEAATAYDSAAIKLRGKDAHRNFPLNNQTLHEPKFQDQYSTDEVLSMIKDGSYPLKFAEFLSTQFGNEGPEAGLPLPRTYVGHHNGVFRRHLFQKALTPSDVGSLNRVVIPKACALKYFPEILSRTEKDEDNNTNYFPMTLNSMEEVKDDGTPKALSLEFYDRMMKSWKFRYCYWSSSQSYVFTKGWSRFVKDRDLKAGDIVAFYACEMNGGMATSRAFCMIDVVYSQSRVGGTAMVEGLQQYGAKMEVGTQLCLGQQVVNYVSNLKDVNESIVLEPAHSSKRKHFKLLGVQIY